MDNKIKEIMNKVEYRLSPRSTIRELRELFKQHPYWSFYIFNNNELIGIVTRNDLAKRGRGLSDSEFVTKIMSKDVVRIDTNDTIQNAGRLIHVNKIKGLAVFDGPIFAGIVTRYDIAASKSKGFNLKSSNEIGEESTETIFENSFGGKIWKVRTI